MRQGLRPSEARRQARIDLGGVEQVKEQVRAGAWLDSFLQDLRYAARMLRKSPAFTAVAVLTLALGIGANAAIFTLTYAVILKSLPVPDPQQLVRYTFSDGNLDLGLSGPLYDALRRRETANQDVLAWSSADLALRKNNSVARVKAALMSGNGFRVLELQPFLGRTFTEADDVPGGGPNGYQALLGYDYWKAHFAGNVRAVGQSLDVNGKAVTIVGVLPPAFDGLMSGERADVVLPMAFDDVLHARHPLRHVAGSFWLTVMGRLKPGKSLRNARANLQATRAEVRREADPTHVFLAGFFKSFRIGVESGRGGRSFLKVTYSRPVLALEVLVGLLLLLCCANTSLLVLAHVSGRLREFAVRSALGAPRTRLFRQVLSEVGLLSVCGLAGGIALGWAGAACLVSMLAGISQSEHVALDVTPQVAILGFTAAISMASAMAAGIWPAVRASRISPLLGLKRDAASMQRRGVGAWIVPAQVAASVVLLAAASLLGGSLLHLLLENSGFHTDGVVMADVDLTSMKQGSSGSTDYARGMAEALTRMRGIKAAAAVSLLPMQGFSSGHYFSLGANGAVHADMNTWDESVTPDYFAAMGTPLLEGRPFATADWNSERVCVLSVSAARYFFPHEDAVGRFVYAGGEDQKSDGKTKASAVDTYRVIGVAADARLRSLREAPPRVFYELARHGEFGSRFSLVVRGSSTSVASGAIREVSKAIIPAAPQPSVFTFDQLIANHLSRERMLTALSTCFAGIALLLTMMGLYGLLARSVALRTKEIGLRLALGARPGHALALVIRQAARLVAIGTIFGVAAAYAATRLLQSLLFGVSPTEPAIFGGVIALLFAVALAAASIPAWRASRIEPMQALRYE
jgi:putative ABC transport system permease protein